jgi:hypothetical protein
VAPPSPERRQLRARIAAYTRHHPDRPDLVEQLQRDLKLIRTEQFIRDVVESPPALRPADIERLQGLLGGEPDVA